MGRLVLAGLVSGLGFLLAANGPFLQSLLDERVPALIGPAGGMVGWLGLAWLAAAVLELAARRATASPPQLLLDLARVFLFAGAVLAILGFVFGQPVAGLVATSSVLVAVVGFALRNMIADVFSGIALNMEHPYRIGDWIEVEPGVVGMVVEVNWRATRLVTRDQTSVVVPNGLIAGSRLVNYSTPGRHYRACIRLALPPSVPVERAKTLLLSAVLGAGRCLSEPRPEVQAEGFDERGVLYVVRYWVADYAEDNPCRDAVASSVARALRQVGIAPAAPRREVGIGPRAEPGAAIDLREELRLVPLFQGLEEGELDSLAAQAHQHRFHEGDVLVAEGDPGGSLFVLAEGALDVRVTSARGEAVTVDRMLPGEVFGEVSLLTGQPRSATVAAVTDGVAFEIRKEHFEPLLRSRPQMAEDLAEVMARRQSGNRQRLAPHMAPEAEEPADARRLLGRLRAFFGIRPPD